VAALYTGYDPTRGETKSLAMRPHLTASSGRGTRRTLCSTGVWTEDVFVLKHEGLFHMFAEGVGDVAHRLTSPDGVRWEEQGRLDIRKRSGEPLSAGAYGTPTVWVEGGTSYLFYERDDKGIWLATSKDLRVWTNVQDEPVIAPGPEAYDRHALALNQVVRYRGRYYGVYHANADPGGRAPGRRASPRRTTSCAGRSTLATRSSEATTPAGSW